MRPQRPLWSSAGDFLSWVSVLLLLAALTAGFLVPGCGRKQSAAPIDRNQPPQTVLVGVPGDSTTSFYHVRLYWGGFDTDGEVVGYEWAITDSLPPSERIPYLFTTRSDSTFVFAVEQDREVLGHRFYVRAIDNEGKRDPSPAWSFFAVRNNCPPTAWYTQAVSVGPEGETVPIVGTSQTSPRDTIPTGWSVRFSWTGSDCDRALNPDGTIDTVGRVAGYTYHLAPLEMNYIGGGETDTFFECPAERLSSNLYIMYVKAQDDAGLSSHDPVVRTFVWNRDPVTHFTREPVSPGASDSVEVFYASTTGVGGPYLAHTSGDTLPLTSPGVTVYATVRAVDPDPPGVIAAFQARLISDSGFWQSLGPDQRFQDGAPHWTGGYRLMARAQDLLGRWDGTPDTLRFFVNHPARWVGEWSREGVHQVQRPQPGGVYPCPTGDTLLVRFGAVDPDPVTGSTTGLEYTYKFDEYPLANGGTGNESLFYPTWAPGLLDNVDPTQVWNREVRLRTGSVFLPGEYVLRVQARESFTSDSERDKLGYRISQLPPVRFRLVQP